MNNFHHVITKDYEEEMRRLFINRFLRGGYMREICFYKYPVQTEIHTNYGNLLNKISDASFMYKNELLE